MNYELTVNTLGLKGDIPCEAAFDLAYDDCVENGIARELSREFGCVVPFLADPTNGVRVCRGMDDNDTLRRAIMSKYK